MSTLTGTAGNDTLTGTSGADSFNLVQGGEDTASGLDGNDTFSMGATLDAGDKIDGGTGSDAIFLRGDYSGGLTFNATTIANIERIALGAGDSYSLTTDNGNVAAGASMIVDGSALGASDIFTFNGSAETDGTFDLIEGAGNDVLRGGQAGDIFDMRKGGGEDTITGGSGNDLVLIGNFLDSGDHIDGGGGANNVVRFNADYSAGLTLAAGTLANIQTLQFGTFSYKITADAATFAPGATAIVNATGLNGSHFLNFDASASSANIKFVGGGGNDVLTGGVGADNFDLSRGGNDTALGGDGNDVFTMGGTLTPLDHIDGGTGSDRVELTGTLTMTFGATTMVNVETLILDAGGTYTLTANDAMVAAGQTLLVRGEGLGAGDSLFFNGQAETDGHFTLRGGAGNDTLTGGAQSDTFTLNTGGIDTVRGGGGDDTTTLGATLTGADSINGGTGNDTVTLNGDYSAGVTFGAATITNIDTLGLAAGHSYNLTTNDANIAAGQTLKIDASTLGAGDTLTFNGAAERDGSFNILGGAGNDTVAMGGALTAANSINGGAGNDTLSLNGDYSAGLTFGAATITNVETLSLAAGHSYNLTTNDANVAAGQTLTIDASALGAGDTLIFNGGAETDGTFHVTGGAGSDTLAMGAVLTAADQFNGGAGNDTLSLNGDYSAGFTFGASALTSVETISLAAGHSYNLTTNDANVAAAQTLTIDGSALGAGNTLTFNGAAETNGSFHVLGGAGNDVFAMGAALTAADTFAGGAGSDTLALNGDYSAGLTLGALTVSNIGTISLAAGHSYNLTTNDGNVASGQTLTIDGSALGAGDTLTFNGGAETNGTFNLIGGAGSDSFAMGAALTTADSINGGAGNDTLSLNGDYSAGLTLGSITNVETVSFAAGHNYNLTSIDADVGAGQTLKLDASALGSGNALTFNGAAETDGSFNLVGGAGNDVLTGGAQADSFDLSDGGSDNAAGGGGNDLFTLGSAFTAADSIDGGAGNDTVSLNGDYSGGVLMNLSTLANVETLQLAAGHTYNLTTNDGNVAAGQTLTVDASALSAANSLTFNGGAETDGSFDIIAGAGNDALTGGNAGNIFDLTHGGADAANGGQGVNVFNLGATFDANDRINGALGATNTLILNGPYLGLTVTNSMVANIQTVDFQGTNTASLVWQQAAFDPLTVDASAAGGSLTFDFSAVNDPLHFIGGALATRITGGAAADTFDAGTSVDTFFGGGGNDTFNFGSHLTASDQANGGTGADVLTLNGDYSGGFTLSATTVTAMGTIAFAAGHDYNITTNDATVASAATMTVDASALGAGNHLTFNGAAETNGIFSFIDGAGNDTLTGGSGADSFSIQNGGTDTAHGGGGNDTFALGATMNPADTIDGGAGNDTVSLNGDYSGGLVLGATAMTSVETLQVAAGNSYNVTTNDANVAAGQSLTVDASALGAANGLTFDGSAETDGTFAFLGGAGNDTLAGGANADGFTLTQGGNDTAHGGGGNDTFTMGATLTAADSIDGGTGNDIVSLNGDYSAGVTFGAATLSNVETLQLAAGRSYNLTTNDGNVAAGQTLTVDGSALGAGDALTFNGAAEADGSFALLAGAGNDTLTGGANADSFTLSSGGNDTVHGGGGNDTFSMGATLTAADSIDGGAGSDTVSLNGDYSAGLTLGAATLTNVETLALANSGAAYSLTTNDGNVASGQTLTVDASALTSALTFNGAAETDGTFAIIGGAGNDALTGGVGNDSFDLSLGGNDTAHGGNGNDTFTLGAALTAANAIDGGAGTDTVILNGDYSAGVTFGAATTTNVETLQLVAGHSYKFTTNDANVGAGLTLTVDATALGAGDVVTFNGAAETNGAYAFKFGGNFTNADQLTGGTATATAFDFPFSVTVPSSSLELNGDYSGGLSFGASIANIGTIQLDAGHSYNLTMADSNVATGKFLYVNAGALGASDTFVFNGSAETNGSYVIAAGAGNDTITGGQGSNFYDLSAGGIDAVTGGSGNDTFYLGGQLNASDTFNGGSAGFDILEFAASAALTATLLPAMLTGIDQIKLIASAGPYNFTTVDADVAAAGVLTLDGSSAGQLTFDGSAETDGSFTVFSGGNNDVITGGAQGDFLSPGFGSDTVHGGGGNDTIAFSTSLDASDTVGGGAGNDTVTVTSGGSLTLGPSTFTSVETLQLGNGTYTIHTDDGNVAAGATLTVDATALAGGASLNFQGNAESDGAFDFKFAGNFNANDELAGGSHQLAIVVDPAITVTTLASVVELNGDYSSGFTFTGSEIIQVGTVRLDAGHNYKLTLSGLTVFDPVVVDGSAVGSANTVNINASAQTLETYTFIGGAGNDTLIGGGTSSKFDISQGGTDFVTGTANADVIYAGDAMFAGENLGGGNGNDTLVLDGDYSTAALGTPGLAFGPITLNSIETITLLESGTDYKLTMNNANNTAGMTIDGSALTHALTFDGTAETSSPFTIFGGSGNDVITGGQGNDFIDLSHGGNDSVVFSGGTDQIEMGATLTAADHLGNGQEETMVLLNGDYSAGLTLAANTLVNMEEIAFQGSFAAKLTMDDGNLTGGAAMAIIGPAAQSLVFDGSAESTGAYDVTGGAANDTLIGGHGNDFFELDNGGSDSVQGNGGSDLTEARLGSHDTFVYVAVSDSTSTTYDRLEEVDYSKDLFNVSTIAAVTGVDTAVTTGALSTATFDSDLAAAVSASHLAANHAVLFTANSGTLSGDKFLVIDENGVAGYQASADLVIQILSSSGTLTVADFS